MSRHPGSRPSAVHPHSFRHSTAVYLLRSGVDPVTISHWLGHSSVETTNRYATVDLETKRQALERAGPLNEGAEPLAPWRADTSVLTWLEALSDGDCVMWSSRGLEACEICEYGAIASTTPHNWELHISHIMLSST